MSASVANKESPAVGRPSNAELQEQYNSFKNTITSLTSKITELETDLNEHKLVRKTLEDTHEDRTCFRMVGPTLVKQTVKDVLPALESNSENLEKIIGTLQNQLRQTQEELTKWRVKYKVQVVQGS